MNQELGFLKDWLAAKEHSLSVLIAKSLNNHDTSSIRYHHWRGQYMLIQEIQEAIEVIEETPGELRKDDPDECE